MVGESALKLGNQRSYLNLVIPKTLKIGPVALLLGSLHKRLEHKLNVSENLNGGAALVVSENLTYSTTLIAQVSTVPRGLVQ